jgi:hypothetical protein
MLGLLVMFGVSFLFTWWIPLWEWALGITYINYFTVQAFVNPYYDSVHPKNMMAKKDEDA